MIIDVSCAQNNKVGFADFTPLTLPSPPKGGRGDQFSDYFRLEAFFIIAPGLRARLGFAKFNHCGNAR